MQDRLHPARLGPSGTEAGGVVRIAGPYPPPPPAPAPAPARTAAGDADVEALLAQLPVVTRYGGTGHRASAGPGPRAGRVWAATSVLLAAAGMGAVVLLPQDTAPARLDVPQAAGAAAISPAPTTVASLAGTPRRATDDRQLPASEPVQVRIPALGMTSEIMELGLERDGSMEVPPGAYPVGWYHGSPTPGQTGPAVLAGHVDWHGEPGAFYGLRELRDGDTVLIERLDGTVATFRVDRVEEHPKDEFPTERVYGDIDHAGLRLITCGGAFDEDTGDYQANVIVFASLVATDA